MRTGAAVRATIIVPSYNHADFVLDAVASALAQTEPSIEILVIDDGSSDDSIARLATLDDPRLTVRTQENVGLSRTLNRGLELARGRWARFLPSDDALHADCIARQLAAAEALPGPGIVFALPEVVDAGGRALVDPAPQAWFDTDARDTPAILRGLLERNFLCAPSALFDRELALAVGGFDPALTIAQDYDLWLKILARAPATLLRERLVRVRWHGANQSAVVTPASEAERARVVVGALERIGIEHWVDLFRASTVPPASDAAARRALAAALERSGLHAVTPFVERLLADAKASEALYAPRAEAQIPGAAAPMPARAPLPPSGRARVGAAVRALIDRFARPEPLRDRPTIESGPRPEHWLVIAADEHPPSSRARRLAEALARTDVRVTLAAGADEAVGRLDAPAGVALICSTLADLRRLLGERDERLRVVVQRADAQVVAFAREAHLRGARIVYDKAAPGGSLARSAIDTERALVDAADDLVGTTRPLVKQLVTSRRLVHLLPDGEDEDGWLARAVSLRRVAAEPTVAVVVLCAATHDGSTIEACLGALAAGRGDRPYRVVAIDDGVAEDVLERLIAREEAQDLVLVRNALRGRASGCNLALRATASEIVVLLDAQRRVPGPGWLDGGIAALLGRRELGAVVARVGGEEAIGGWVWLAPRPVLLRVAGFDEAYDPGSYEDLDMEQQLRALGYDLGAWSDLGAALPVGEVAPAQASHALRVGERHFRRKWRRSPRSVESASPRMV